MESAADQPADVQRLTFKTYLAMVQNAPGSKMFRNFYLRRADGSEFDAIDSGDNACAYFVSSVLVVFAKLERIHGTVAATIKDLEASGWHTVSDPLPGDVLVWEPSAINHGHAHIGFCTGPGRAVSTSSSRRVVAEHELNFGPAQRHLTAVYHQPNWSQP